MGVQTHGASALVRVDSYRARRKLFALIGETQGYFSWHRRGEWRECPPELLAEAIQITGIRRAKWSNDMRGYMNWSWGHMKGGAA